MNADGISVWGCNLVISHLFYRAWICHHYKIQGLNAPQLQHWKSVFLWSTVLVINALGYGNGK